MRQLDLFHDSTRTIVLNVLREAIVARNALEAGITFERLLNLDPGHEMASDAGTLIAILETPAPEGPDEGIEWLHALEQEWRPAAVRLLGTGDGRDFLAPVWRCIGEALGPRPFEPVHPERHPSWAYLQGQDWENLKRSVLGVPEHETTRSVLGVPEHETTPVLLARLAEAEYRLGDRTRAIEHWFALCWRAPAVLRGLVDDPDFPDADVAAAWNAAQDQDVEPVLSPEWFPAWMLLQEPSLAARLAPSGKNDGPRRAFDLVYDLLTNRVSDAHGIVLRRELKALHPALLTAYLNRFAGN